MEGRVEAGDVQRMAGQALRCGNAGQVVRLVQGRQRDEGLKRATMAGVTTTGSRKSAPPCTTRCTTAARCQPSSCWSISSITAAMAVSWSAAGKGLRTGASDVASLADSCALVPMPVTLPAISTASDSRSNTWNLMLDEPTLSTSSTGVVFFI